MPFPFEPQTTGKSRRLRRIFQHNVDRCVILPLDEAMISGPRTYLNRNAGLIDMCVASGADAIMAHLGTLRNHPVPPELGRIMNLSASTTRATPTRKTLVSTVEQAIVIDADAVAYQLHIGSRYETEMLHSAGEVVQRAAEFGLPTMLVAYARSEGRDGNPHEFQDLRATDYAEYINICAHAARVAVEIGADIVKTQYPGDPEGFSQIVEACSPIPVVIAGGPFRLERQILNDVVDAMKVGGGGVSIGRSVFDSHDPSNVLRQLAGIVHAPIG